MKEKGIKILFSVFLLASLLMPFSVSAAEQTQIVPTWNWGSQYANQFTVTNFCEGSGTAVSCELRFTANNSYYGYLSFDGYNGTTKWIDYKNVWIADGYGAYRYSLYQNGVIQINKINIEGGFLKSSMDNLDLQDIIDLLTAIETDTTSIDNQMNTELQRLQSIINNQVVQNGYLETLTKMHDWHFPIESYGFIYPLLYNNRFQLVNIGQYDTYTFPIFKLTNNTEIYSKYCTKDVVHIVIGTVAEFQFNGILDGFDFTFGNYTCTWSDIKNYKEISRNQYTTVSTPAISEIVKFDIIKPANAPSNILKITSKNTYYFMPIYFSESDFVSTEFALQFGLSNQLLDDLHIIAQGTQQSNSAASGLESSNSTMASDMNSMATIENGYSQDFNSQLQNIDFTNPIQQNQGILPAANFVISIFNGLISNNPFTVLIIIVCILLIGKKVIGK